MKLLPLLINLAIKIFGQNVFWEVIRERQEYKNEIKRIIFDETEEIRKEQQAQKLMKEQKQTAKVNKRTKHKISKIEKKINNQ